jgi:RNA polymerase sigma-70 factor (ECF subfamily)
VVSENDPPEGSKKPDPELAEPDHDLADEMADLELSRPGRVLSSKMSMMSYEMVERGPLAPAAARVAGRVVEGGHAVRQAEQAEDPDRELLDRWRQGDERAFEQLVRRHERKVFRLLLRMMGNREEAEDVAQETFLSLHRHGHRFRGDALFSTFVYRVASNAALNRRRTLGRNRARIQKLAIRQAAGDNLPTAPRNPEDAATGADLSVQVRKAIRALKPSLRLPVVLYDIEGLAYGEIAQVLGVAEGTVKSRIHRARQALRAELEGLLGDSNCGARK